MFNTIFRVLGLVAVAFVAVLAVLVLLSLMSTEYALLLTGRMLMVIGVVGLATIAIKSISKT